MKQRTNSFTIHSFHLNFPNFIPEIIRPLYISTSILSTFFPWNREYVKINSLLIPYFSEFSFFFKSKTRKKKRTNLLLFKFTKFHSLLNRLYLFQQSSSHRETKNGQSRFSSISYLSANFFSQLSSPRFLTNIYTMKHTEGGGGGKVDSLRFHVPIPLCCTALPSLFRKLGRPAELLSAMIRGEMQTCSTCSNTGPRNSIWGFKIENTISGKTFNRFRGVLHFDRYFKWPPRPDSFSRPFSCSLRLKYTWWRAESNE